MLLDEIITVLGSTEGKLTDALIKTKILLHQIGKKELAEWVNYELNGYPKDVEVPEYRILPSNVKANVANAAWMFNDQSIPTSHMDDVFQEHFLQCKIRESLAICEDWNAKSGNGLRRAVPMEYNHKLSEPLTEGTGVINAWCMTPIHNVKGIITQVRSRLLDFLLELRSSMGDVITDDDVKKEAAKVDASNLFNNAVFGHNTTIMVGSHNTQNVKNKVEAGDLAALVKVLTDAGVPAEDIEELKTAIAEDVAVDGQASFEGRTGNWLTRTLGKLAKGTIKLGTEVTADVIAAAVSGYVGLHG
jgi:hypothetical protein